ncbi:hypothetical protein COCON_G00194070 [Conger conger]|uniref:B-cell lymphoma 9 beta-catenin binding domain-containing protein n=1 Tax=Conger conger TaxID=82655 RepID=A0A9Q1HQ64_CONCO|nr:hypothetical protein COCON_G00194070 [Conger conger]
MLEVQEERAAVAPHFGRKERPKSEGANAQSERRDGPADRGPRAKAPPAAAPAHPAPPSAASGSPSMHSGNPKVRNSPSENSQSSPKSKQEAMVRSPPVMSPSSAAQMDSKLPNQGKQGGTSGQSQPSPCDSKTLGCSKVAKGSPAPSGNLALKNGQGLNSTSGAKGLNSAPGTKGLNSGSGAKGKVKRERSTSVESFEQRDTGTPSNEPDQKDSRVKRMCVAERRQPYSGADWCSGGESEDDEPRFFNCSSGDVKSQGSGSLPSSNAGVSRSSTPSHNAVSEPATNQKPPSKIVYVFTTEMANKAADAVLTGHADTIIAFHMKNISHSKADKQHLPPVGPLRNEPKPLQQTATAPEQNHQGAQLALGSPRSPSPMGPRPGFPSLEGGLPKGMDLKMSAQHHQQLANEIMSSMGENAEGLSQEQLEHRERSLQTLRDIQRMLFPDNDKGPAPNPAGVEGPRKPDQGPLQAMMAQSQSLGKPGPSPRREGSPFGPSGPRDMPFSPEELGPPGPGLGPGEHMSPEQVAWLKLQQEFYEEKRRKQEQLQHRPLPDMMLHQHGPRGPMRGPPPPYQMSPGEVWGPGGPEPFPEQMNMGPRGMHPPHHMQRMPFPMMHPNMDAGPSPMPRPGVPWPDDVPKMGDGRGFPPGQGVFGGPGGGGEVPQSAGCAGSHVPAGHG